MKQFFAMVPLFTEKSFIFGCLENLLLQTRFLMQFIISQGQNDAYLYFCSKLPYLKI